MKARLIFILLIVVAVLFAVTFSIDSISGYKSALAALSEAEKEVARLETRYANLLKQDAALPSQVLDAIANHQAATNGASRRSSFDALEVLGQQYALETYSAENPVQRRLTDELAGALNRRTIAMQRYSELLNECNHFAASTQGSWAQLISGFPKRCDEARE
ncbi:MAG: hypothetical protein J5J00_11285 [Deltaproteobacteria bacterium]|nr:hypothetical protein [Deltaproteobacteria bacterium]